MRGSGRCGSAMSGLGVVSGRGLAKGWCSGAGPACIASAGPSSGVRASGRQG